MIVFLPLTVLLHVVHLFSLLCFVPLFQLFFAFSGLLGNFSSVFWRACDIILKVSHIVLSILFDLIQVTLNSGGSITLVGHVFVYHLR